MLDDERSRSVGALYAAKSNLNLRCSIRRAPSDAQGCDGEARLDGEDVELAEKEHGDERHGVDDVGDVDVLLCLVAGAVDDATSLLARLARLLFVICIQERNQRGNICHTIREGFTRKPWQ